MYRPRCICATTAQPQCPQVIKPVKANRSGSARTLLALRPSRTSWTFSHVSRLTSRSEEHTSELQSLMRISYAVFCLKKKTNTKIQLNNKDNIDTKQQTNILH